MGVTDLRKFIDGLSIVAAKKMDLDALAGRINCSDTDRYIFLHSTRTVNGEEVTCKIEARLRVFRRVVIKNVG